MLRWIKSGAPWIWLTAGAVSISLISVLSLLLFIGWKGLLYFWPSPLYQWQTEDNQLLIGQLYDEEIVPLSHLDALNIESPQGAETNGVIKRLSIKIGNRERYQEDFVSILDLALSDRQAPEGWAVIDRRSDGQFYGKPIAYQDRHGQKKTDIKTFVQQGLINNNTLQSQVDQLIEKEIHVIGKAIERLQLERRRLELDRKLTSDYLERYEQQKQRLDSQLRQSEQRIDILRQQLNETVLLVKEMTGAEVAIPLQQVVAMWYPNDMSMTEKIVQWGTNIRTFLTEKPRESNSEGGVFPAILGTILLVLMMSIMVIPLGVIAAIYLHEYAKDTLLTRIIRIAIINLAGVPSIVYGVFGLGFFVYTMGASIDTLFYKEYLPAPTFGTPGILWSALTLALLTLPIVIVTTEEGLARIPNEVRHGSLALGATRFETILHVVLPMATPAILTGGILAIARAAGEVAPLMLVGVVKLTSNLPIDGEFPFIHLERKFMHLGFHIYDLGFQTTHVETARPLVYATSFLLMLIVVILNLTAINIRNSLREKYRTLGQD